MSVVSDKQYAEYREEAQKFWDNLYQSLGEYIDSYNGDHHSSPLTHFVQR